MTLQVAVRPAQDDVTRSPHACKHLARRDDLFGTFGSKKRAFGVDARDREERYVGPLQRVHGVDGMINTFDALIRPWKAVGPNGCPGPDRTASDLLLARVAGHYSDDSVLPAHCTLTFSMTCSLDIP